jgi:hypothetical protein
MLHHLGCFIQTADPHFLPLSPNIWPLGKALAHLDASCCIVQACNDSISRHHAAWGQGETQAHIALQADNAA